MQQLLKTDELILIKLLDPRLFIQLLIIEELASNGSISIIFFLL